ncbi:MAG: alpha-ketoacid dehydrogenase subunit beta [Acidimicrobiia bacterium]|nr:alpha-ketoacid dehydrogenase subunit beta [Acidimicrobiia bacterium]
MSDLNMAQAMTAALDHVLAIDPAAVLLGEDVGLSGGVFRVTDGLQAKHGVERVIDTPVAESGIVGAAFGMAVAGLHPVAEIQFLGFAYPAFDQVVSHVSRIRNRSQHRFTAPLVIRIPYGAGIGAAEHHSESTEALFAHTPGLKVVIPSTPADAAGLLITAVADPDPVVFLEPIRSYRRVRGEVAEPPTSVPFGEAAVRRPGTDLTLISYGAMMPDVLDAADQLAAEGVEAEVIDLRTLVPLDLETVLESVSGTGRVVIVQEGHRTCGFAAELAASIQEHALYSLEAPVARVTGWDTVVPLRRAEHQYVPSVARIMAAAQAAMAGV